MDNIQFEHSQIQELPNYKTAFEPLNETSIKESIGVINFLIVTNISISK